MSCLEQQKGADTREITPARLDLRVGKVLSVKPVSTFFIFVFFPYLLPEIGYSALREQSITSLMRLHSVKAASLREASPPQN